MISSYEISGVRTEHLRSIFVSTYGILFLGTPHKGADLASWGSFLEWLARAVPKKALDTSPQLIDALKTNSETLQNIDRQFAQLLERFHLFFFHEAKPTDMKGTLRFVSCTLVPETRMLTIYRLSRKTLQHRHCQMLNEPAYKQITPICANSKMRVRPALTWSSMVYNDMRKRRQRQLKLDGTLKNRRAATRGCRE